MPKSIAHPDPTAVLDTAAKFFRVMAGAGASFEQFTAPLQNVAKRKNLAEYLNLGCPKVDGNGVVDFTPLPQGLARFILGDDFITPEEVANARGLVYTDEQLEALEISLPSLEWIARCRANGYMLLPNPAEAMSLLQIRDLKRDIFYSKEGSWYADQAFAREEKTKAATWLAVRKNIVPDSIDKNWQEQLTLISGIERVPNAAEACWALTTYKEVRGVNLIPTIYARTLSLDSHGDRVVVGDFVAEGLFIGSNEDHRRSDELGVSSAMNF